MRVSPASTAWASERARAKRIELVAGTDHGVALPDRSPAIRALLEQFVRDPAATVAG